MHVPDSKVKIEVACCLLFGICLTSRLTHRGVLCVFFCMHRSHVGSSHFGSRFAAPRPLCAPVHAIGPVLPPHVSSAFPIGSSAGAPSSVASLRSSSHSATSVVPSPSSACMSPAWRGPRFRKRPAKKPSTSSPSCAASAHALSTTGSSHQVKDWFSP